MLSMKKNKEIDLKNILESNKTDYFLKNIDIDEYCNKLLKYSFFESIYLDVKLVGFVAYYINGEKSYISMLIIDKEYQGLGLSKKLFNSYLLKMKENKIKTIELEVRKNNEQAIKIYNDYNFIQQSMTLDKIKMSKDI